MVKSYKEILVVLDEEFRYTDTDDERGLITKDRFAKAVLRAELCTQRRKVNEYWRLLKDLEIIKMLNKSAATVEIDELRRARGMPTLSEQREMGLLPSRGAEEVA